MQQIQLDFFKSDEECEIEQLKKTIDAVKTSADKVRKGTYARINELNKNYLNIEERLAFLEKYICEKKVDN
jgi:hypothetical protein